MQFYHRRVCWLALREFRRAATDADHTLAFMDFVRDHSPDEEWTLSHEQYRPFVLFHRTQAATLATLEEAGPEEALQELNRGLQRFRELFTQYEAEEQFEDDELVQRLMELRDTLRAAVRSEAQFVANNWPTRWRPKNTSWPPSCATSCRARQAGIGAPDGA